MAADNSSVNDRSPASRDGFWGPRPDIGNRPAEASAAARFREQLNSRQSDLDDSEPEDELWKGGYSAKAMTGTWILLSIATIVLLASTLGPVSFPIALGLILVLWAIGLICYAVRRLGVHYTLTSQRFVHESGVVTRKTDRIEVIDIDDVSFTQGPVQRALGVGTIVVSSSDRSHPELSMVGIENVREVAGLIDDIRRKERRRRSLHIESI